MVAIIVVLTVIVFIVVDGLLRIVTQKVHASKIKKGGAAVDVGLERSRKRQAPRQAVSAPGRHGEPELALPAGLFVHPGHTWAEILRSGQARVGLDDFVRYALGRPDRLILRQPGEQVRQGEPMLTVEQAGRQLVLPAPVSGMIEDRNEQLAVHPDALEGRAYGENWAYTLKPSRLGAEIGSLKVAEKACTWLREEMQRLIAWIGTLPHARPGVAMQDGGTLVFGVLS